MGSDISLLQFMDQKMASESGHIIAPFTAVRSAGRTAQIMRGPVFLQKSPRTLVESTRSPGLLSSFFFVKKTLELYRNQPAIQGF
jgi:hypothetical protein